MLLNRVEVDTPRVQAATRRESRQALGCLAHASQVVDTKQLSTGRSARPLTTRSGLPALVGPSARPVVDNRPPCLAPSAGLDNYTNNVSNLAQTPRKDVQRQGRYALRDGLRRWTNTPRVAKCGRCRIASDVQVKKYAGRAHYSGLLSCGNVWLCPVCASKIATRRTGEVHDVLTAHLTAGGGAEFLTLTLPHDAGDALAVTRRIAADGWRRVQQGREWMALKHTVGITGAIRTLEVTHGKNGWHPHLHIVVLTCRPFTDAERAQLLTHAFTSWRVSVVKAGQRAPLPEHTTLTPVRDASDVSAYVTKIKVALEVTQGAAKTGRTTGQRTPFAVLADFLEYGDADDLAVWREWEAGIKGAKQLTWSRGLRAQFNVADVTDEALAAEDVGGVEVASLSAEEWHVISRTPTGPCAVLEAAERGGADAVRLCVAALLKDWPPNRIR